MAALMTLQWSGLHIGVSFGIQFPAILVDMPEVAPEVIEQSGATTASDIW